MAKSFDPTKCIVTIGGVVINGHDMSDWATVSMRSDLVDDDLSGDGIVTYNEIVDSRGDISIKVKQNAPCIIPLETIISTGDLLDITYIDMNVLETYTLQDCRLKKMPDATGTDKNPVRTYDFMSANVSKVGATGIISSVAKLLNNASLLG